MRIEEFIQEISSFAEDTARFEEIRRGLPIGKDSVGNILLAQKREKPLTVRNTCVTGVGRTNFIRRFLITLACLHDRGEACFFVLSPRTEYGELIRLLSADITVPYIHTKADLDLAIETVKELLRMREEGKGYPRLFIVLDGLDELEDCNKNGDFEEYRALFELLTRKSDIDLICGLDLMKSIFAGYPGAFLGVGNCLITTREEGKADVTYVSDDGSLSMPQPVHFPSEPSVMESVIYLNSLLSQE